MSSNEFSADRLAQHYAPASAASPAGPDLPERLLAALTAAGHNLDALQLADLAPLDQFHNRGRAATLELAQRAGLSAGQRILDLGGGLGGAARTLAAEFGCAVVVLDLTPAYVQAGEVLTRLVGLDERVTFRHGDALDLPFAACEFDVVWTQHSTMNIPDKPRLYAQAWRVLRPGGRLALHEIVGGPAGPVHLPVPWAVNPADSHLLSQAAHRAAILQAGFGELEWIDESATALKACQSQLASMRARNGVPFPLGLHLLLGPAFPEMFANLVRSLAEQRLAIVQAVFQRL